MWKAKLHGIDPLGPATLSQVPGRIATLGESDRVPNAIRESTAWDVYREIGVINDVRLLIRARGRVVAGITLWRALHGRAWTRRQLRLLDALQPLIEMAYVAALRTNSGLDIRLPATLTRRERQVARVLATGATNAELARALYVSPNTAKSHTRAVLAKLGVASRRELVTYGARGSAEAALQTNDAQSPESSIPFPEQSPHPSPPAGPILVEGDQTPQRLLTLVLDWAAERIGAAIGGCAVFSARLELVAEAWAIARPDEYGLDWRIVRGVHRHVLPPLRPREVVHRFGDHTHSPVVELDVAGLRPGDRRLTELVAKLGLTTPLLTMLRLQGRVAGLIWLSRDSHAAIDEPESGRELRRLHPLLELAYATPLGESHTRVSRATDLADCDLTPQELTVARLALSGKSNAAIASTLRISLSTVENHMTRVFAKCGVRSRTQLIAILADASDSQLP